MENAGVFLLLSSTIYQYYFVGSFTKIFCADFVGFYRLNPPTPPPPPKKKKNLPLKTLYLPSCTIHRATLVPLAILLCWAKKKKNCELVFCNVYLFGSRYTHFLQIYALNTQSSFQKRDPLMHACLASSSCCSSPIQLQRLQVYVPYSCYLATVHP